MQFLEILARVIRNPSILRSKLLHGIYRSELLMRRGRGWSLPPDTVAFLPTFSCSLACRMCEVRSEFFEEDGGPKFPPLRAERLLQTVDALCRGKPMVVISGGEPLLHPEILTILERVIRRNRCFSAMITNGQTLATRARELTEIGLPLLYVSIDGLGATHDAVRGPGAFARLREGLDALDAEKRRQGKTCPELAAVFTITSANFEEIAATYRTFLDWKINWTEVHHLTVYPKLALARNWAEETQPFWRFEKRMGGADAEWCPGPAEAAVIHRQTEEIKDAAGRHGVKAFIQPDFSVDEIVRYYSRRGEDIRPGTFCHIPWKLPCVFPDGTVRVFQYCFLNPAGRLPEDDLGRIWNGPLYREVRRRLAAGKAPAICNLCPNKYQW
jgi:MoaA/NifB/PqqE/SkfB family radical SAM enzyme